jgi:PAS domain S-box-containing protein
MAISTGGFNARSELGRQLSWRLVVTTVVALAVVLLVSLALYDAALRRYAQSQINNAVEFYKGRLLELDEGWQYEAARLKSRLEFSRVLEDAVQRQASVQSYFTVQGEERVFSHVFVLNRKGELVASAGKSSGDLLKLLSRERRVGAHWLYDTARKQLFRSFLMPVWLGRDGQGQLLLLLPMDHALLYTSASYQSELFLLWDQVVVASSLGAKGLGDPHLQPNNGGWDADGTWVEQRALTWGEQTPGPMLVVRQNVHSPLPAHYVWLFGLIVVGGVMLVVWWVLGRWMAQVAGRAALLGEVSRKFTSQSNLTPQLKQQLETAASGSKDEIHDVAVSLQALTQAVQGREQELERHVVIRTAELRDANDRAEEVNHMLYTVLDTIPVRLFWKDRNLVYLGCNRLFAMDAGKQSPQQVVGATDFDMSWRDVAELYRKDDAQVIDSGQPKLSYEELQTGPHDEMVWLRTSKVPLRDATGAVVGVLGTYENITEHKKIESALHAAKDAAESASRAKSEFLASMSHELRTPLNAILGFSQLFGMDAKLPQETRESAREIERAGQHLLSLVNDLIDLARVEVGKLELSLEPVPLKPVVGDSLAMVASLARQHGIELLDEAGDCQTATVRADYVRLRQVVINLLSNAIKYNRAGGTVRINCLQHADKVRISVTDTGLGIPASKQDRIFNAFDRLGAERGQIEGTGIGLVITKRIVEAMGGAVGFQSNEGQGSTFWVEFALSTPTGVSALHATPALDAPASASLSPDVPVSRPVVLYIEDNPMNQRLMQQIFTRRPDLELRDANTAEIGLELARTVSPALILMDINLPGMNGFEALAALKVDPRTAHIPVIAVSANAMKGDREHGIKAGFADYLTKPLHIPDLLTALQQVISAGIDSKREAQ